VLIKSGYCYKLIKFFFHTIKRLPALTIVLGTTVRVAFVFERSQKYALSFFCLNVRHGRTQPRRNVKVRGCISSDSRRGCD